MSINTIIKTALTSISAPVSYMTYTGTTTPYITYQCYNEQGEAWAEDKEVATGFYCQVDVFGKTDCTAMAEQVKAAMITAGFKRTTAIDLYETDTKLYHKALRFSYV